MRLTTFSRSDGEMAMTPKQRYDRAAADMLAQIARRRRIAAKMWRRARNLGYDVTVQDVLDSFPWYSAWDSGLIRTGQLVHRLGLRKMSRADYLEWSKTMNIPRVVMLDTVGTAAANIPASTPYVGGYVSGTGVVPWSAGDWALFPHARHNRIYQWPNISLDPHAWDTLDVENNAVTPAEAAQEHKLSVDAGIRFTNIYGTRTSIAATVAAIKALGGDYFVGHVTCTLADWNLNEEEASALIGTFVEEVTCVGVQWASPESNPNTVVPGGSHTLAQSNIDINVVDGNWIPGVSFSGFTPPTPTPTVEHGEVVTQDSHGNYVGHDVSSTDGIHWQ